MAYLSERGVQSAANLKAPCKSWQIHREQAKHKGPVTMGGLQRPPDLMQGLPRPIVTGQGTRMSSKVSPSLYVRRAKARVKKDVSWGHALQRQKLANAAYDTDQYEHLQRHAEEAAENFLQMDERIAYLTLRIYWESGKALNDPDAQSPEDCVLQLARERDRRGQSRHKYWSLEVPVDQIPRSRRMQARLDRLNAPKKPPTWLLIAEDVKADEQARAIEREKRAEILAIKGELRKIRSAKTAPARAEDRRLKAIERARKWRADQKAKTSRVETAHA